MIARQTNLDRLKAWFNENPEKAWAALLGQGLQVWTVEKIITGKVSAPRTLTRRAFVAASGIPENELFPVKQTA